MMSILPWETLSSIIRLLIGVILIWKLYRFNHLFNGWERYGMALGSGSCLLTIDVIWEGAWSPYQGWSTFFFSLGMLLYFIGRTTRHWRHERNNRKQIEMAKNWGKSPTIASK